MDRTIETQKALNTLVNALKEALARREEFAKRNQKRLYDKLLNIQNQLN
jgi:hypothetical protein